ncbi:unnamed protein product [Dibothriocephalus latus]|uniref:G-protein coupled receptors family 1 profile domain-containing protein n=1 Tax=Dibothriocephalus latus TaxID=60516 RepID=A0A3P7LBG9_DIBLA|nr:unnamed protein product [Dibothriocephalus latus]
MVVVFVVCWIPLNALWIIVDELGNEAVPNFEVVFLACHISAMCSAVSNPLLYAFLNENFRKNIGAAFSSCFLKRSAVGLSTHMAQDQKSGVNVAKISVSNNEENAIELVKSGIIKLNDEID